MVFHYHTSLCPTANATNKSTLKIDTTISSPDGDSLRCLDEEHVEAINRAVHNVLATELALETYMQIIDGLTLSEVAWESTRNIEHDHPINSHVALCNGVAEKARKIQRDFELDILKFKPELLETYRSAPKGSREFGLRLVEVTAAALHGIAVFLAQQNFKLHDPATTNGSDAASVTTWEPPPAIWPCIVPSPTLFTHRSFTAFGQYPDGVADMVGYWAEDRILGGVALFDRSQLWHEDSEPNVYFQSGRVDITFRTWQLLDAQQQALLSFLLTEADLNQTSSPLPILPSSKNTVRVDPVDAIPVHKVYRDPWERAAPRLHLRMQRYTEPCTRSSLDYPEIDVDAEIRRLNRM